MSVPELSVGQRSLAGKEFFCTKDSAVTDGSSSSVWIKLFGLVSLWAQPAANHGASPGLVDRIPKVLDAAEAILAY